MAIWPSGRASSLAIAAVAIAAVSIGSSTQRQIPAPHELNNSDALIVWLPSIAVTGMTFYTGDRFPHWKRNVFVGGLREGGIPRTGQIQRIVFNDRWEELRREPMLTLKQRIRDIRQGPDGLLYVLTAEDDGTASHRTAVSAPSRDF